MNDLIKKTVKRIKSKFYEINFSLFKRNNILLESNPDFSDNTKAVFDELIKQEFNKKYKIIWFVKNKNCFKDIKIKNVKFLKRKGSIFCTLRFNYYNRFSKYIIDCNDYIRKYNKNQFRIHLTHGEILKVPLEYTQASGDIDYLVQTSDFFKEIVCKSYQIDESKIAVCGFPRNDYLFMDDKKIFNLYPEIQRKKIIIWLPTYRNHKGLIDKNNSTYVMNINFKYGVPSINNENDLQEINNILKDLNILLLIKLHPAEDSSKIKNLDLSNIKIIEDEIFEKNHTNLYQLLSITDALITDYSSVYYDYLLTDKPIGLAISDLNEYKKHIDLLFDDYEKNIAGEYIYTIDDLKNFIVNVGTDNDIALEDRMEKKKIYHKYYDSDSSKRVIDLLKNKIKDDDK